MFGSFGAGFGSFGAGVGGLLPSGLLPSFTNITSWLKTPTADGKTLDNSKGADATLTGVNCVDFDGSLDRVAVDSAGGVDLTTDVDNHFGSCVITATFRQDVAGTQVVYSCGSASYRLFTQNFRLKVNASSTEIFPIETGKVYRSTITYSASGQATNFVLENLTDGTTQTDSITRPAGSHGGSGGFQIGARNGGLVWNGKISNVSVSNSSVGANIHLPLSEGYGSVAYDVSGNGANGNIIGTTWATLDGIESWNHQYGFDIEASFNGSSDHIDLSSGFTLGTSWEIETTLASSSSGAGDGRPFGMVEGNNVFQFESGNSQAMNTLFRDSSGNQVSSSITPSDRSDFNTYKVVRDGNSLTYFLNGSQVDTDDASSLGNIVIANPIIGARSGNIANFSGSFKTWKLTIAGVVTVDYDFAINPDNGSYSKIRIPALNFNTTQVATFDGVADRVEFDLGTFNTSAWTCKATIQTANTLQAQGDLFSQAAGTGTGRAWLRINSNGSATTFLGGQGLTALAPSGTFVANTKYDVELIYNGSNSLQLKTTTSGTTTTHTAVTRTVEEATGNFKFFVGHTGSAQLKGTAFSMEVVGLTQVDFQSDIGTTTVQDTTTNNNDGTITVGSGGLATFWGTRVADTSGLLVSADYNSGNLTISNPAGFVHNGSECGVAMVLTSTQLFAIDNSTATETFVRKDNGNIVQILDYSAPLTGNDLARTRSYVG
jgi:hypothetical protein